MSQYGNVSEVGKSFGVIKLSADGEDYDFSLPRTESKSGEKHQDFSINSKLFIVSNFSITNLTCRIFKFDFIR